MVSTALEHEQLARLLRPPPGEPISQPPSIADRSLDRTFRALTLCFASLTLVLVLYIVWEVGSKAAPAMQKYGLRFLTSSTWDVNRGQFGVLPAIWGILYSSALALLLGGIFGGAMVLNRAIAHLSPRGK